MLDIILCILVIASLITNLIYSNKIIQNSNNIFNDSCVIKDTDNDSIITLLNTIMEKLKRLENNDIATRHMIATKLNEINNKLNNDENTTFNK